MAMAKKRELPGLVKFRVGDRVRVKQGIRDADYPDMPLGELEVPERKPNRPLIEDYAYWFWNNR